MNIKGPFYDALEKAIVNYGGKFNAHLHLDRYATLDDKYMRDANFKILENSHISLHKKHSLIAALHSGPAFDVDDLEQRVNECLDIMQTVNTFRADTMVDVTADRVGLSAIETLRKIKEARKDKIDLRLAVYSPLGFRDDEPCRWETFVEGAKIADFIGALPESDDINEYPEHIGFEEHCRRMLALAMEYKIPIHVHTDQRNEPSEDGTERLIKVIKEMGIAKSDDEPWIWTVHMISPSTYDEDRFQSMLNDLVDLNIGVICCPSAAIGMRQLRSIKTPTYNSIPRVLEMLAAGVRVRLASDNIADICSPSTTPDLTDEVFILSAAIRFYQIDILAKLAAGVALDQNDIIYIKDHLEKNQGEINKVIGQ